MARPRTDGLTYVVMFGTLLQCVQNVQKAVNLMHEIESWIVEIPPVQQPMRFGNRAFRTFYDRVIEVRARASERRRHAGWFYVGERLVIVLIWILLA